MTRDDGAATSPEPGSTRDLILDVAERRFAEQGFSGVAMREIAADVGLKNQASLYHHFRNKRALYEAVMARGIDPIVAMAEQAVEARKVNPAVDRNTVDAGIDGLFDHLIAHPHLPRLFQRGLYDSRYLRNAASKVLFPLSTRSMSALLKAGGPWKSEDLAYITIGFYNLIVGYLANASLAAMALQADPMSPAAVSRQRRFVKITVARMLGLDDTRPRAERAPAVAGS